ncbi:MAG TPA: hypothetical protein VK733_08255, partial [Gemmatimonadaceae bacterium]|nr:hypothetical protein [Gemmatimonadaceae bacterium]
HRRDPDQQPRVRYVPQGFFDKITNETIADERSGFYREIQKVIFSHVPPHSRLDCTNLDDLLNALTAASQTEITRLRHRLSDVNGMIASLEDDASPRRVRALERLIIDKQAEIAALEARPPLAVPLARGETTETDAIDALRVLEAELEAQRSQVEVNLARIVEQRHAIDTARQQLTSAVNDLRDTIHDTRRALEAAGVGVDLGSCVTVTLKTEPLDAARTAIDEQQGAADTLAGDLTLRLAETRQAQADRVQRLEQESAAYEAYRTAQVEWQQRLSALRGDTGMPAADSQLGLQVQLRDLQEGIPVRIAELRDERNTLCRAIHEALSSLARQHSDVTRPVQEHIAADDLTRDHYRLAFNVALRPANLAPLLFGLIKQTGGPFHGVDAGEQRLREMVSEAEIESADGAIAFAHALLMMLADNHAVDPAILKQNHSVAELYDLIFGLTYLRPSYVLALNDQPLSRLSPGERGILLLVFYLCVDRGDEPLIIDQPEGNLNNQSIVENLVPVFKKAKARRQIIIVTHNPNIAVVCDAEQIIHCTMDIAAGFRLSYESGALENPKFNRLTLDLLEGTAPAFQSRRETYSPASGDRL